VAGSGTVIVNRTVSAVGPVSTTRTVPAPNVRVVSTVACAAGAESASVPPVATASPSHRRLVIWNPFREGGDALSSTAAARLARQRPYARRHLRGARPGRPNLILRARPTMGAPP